MHASDKLISIGLMGGSGNFVRIVWLVRVCDITTQQPSIESIDTCAKSAPLSST